MGRPGATARAALVAGLAAAATAIAGCGATTSGGTGRPPTGDPFADLAALAARAAPDDDPSTVDLLLAPDAAFLRRHGREAVPLLLRAVETVDRVLGPPTGLRFRVGGATLFPSTPDARDDLRLLWEARLRVLRGGCDAVAAFTGQDCGERAGAALPERRLVLCADATDPERNLLHEVAHLFGALDYHRGHPGYAVPGPMSYDADLPRVLDLDAPTLERVRAHAGPLPPAAPDAFASALAARVDALPGPVGAALVGAFLTAESRRSQREGLAPAERALRDLPGDALALYAYGECRRLEGDRDDGAALFLAALRAVGADGAPPDAVDRHVALAVARLAIDDVDGTAPLRGSATDALDRVLAAFPGDAEVLEIAGSLRARAGDGARAEALYREAALADPASHVPWRRLAELARGARRAELWLEAWREARRRRGPDPELGLRWVVEGLREFPALLARPDVRAEAEAALAAAAAAWPAWPDPARVRAMLEEAVRVSGG